MKSLSDYLLIKFTEELNEAGQAVSKVLTFGIDDVNPHTNLPNQQNVLREMIDVHVIIHLLRIFGVKFEIQALPLCGPVQKEYFHKKILKVLRYTKISEKLGRVQITDDEWAAIHELETRAAEKLHELGTATVDI